MSERFSTSSLLLLLCLLLFSTISPAAVKELDYIVAIVNDDVIAKSELDNKTREMPGPDVAKAEQPAADEDHPGTDPGAHDRQAPATAGCQSTGIERG